MLKDLLAKRNLPQLLKMKDGSDVTAQNWEERRQEILEVLGNEIFGVAPPAPNKVSADITNTDDIAYGGKVTKQDITLSFKCEKGKFSFPMHLITPNGVTNPSVILNIAFRKDIPDRYFPVEEVLDRGVAVAMFCYTDITSDTPKVDGLASMFTRTKGPNDWGKIAMWSWCASRVMDYLQTVKNINKENISVMGHSRLGKTALLTGSRDLRFACAISNNAGCSGDSLARGTTGETIRDIYTRFEYWFCDNYEKYMDNEQTMPFDQHFLVAAVAPRRAYVSSAAKDCWADPASQYLCCFAASEVYEALGTKGLVCPDRLPVIGDTLHEGHIGYHMRDHGHALSRYDWNKFIDYINLL